MPAKRSKCKLPFKVFSANNYSKFASRFPFLKQRQIKAKLFQAWRKTFDCETGTDKGDIPNKNKQLKETLLSKDDDRPVRPEGKKSKYFVKTYSETRHSREPKPQEHQTKATAQASQSSTTTSVSNPVSNLDNKEGPRQRPLNQKSKENELIDLFQETSAEQLLIEPKDMNLEDIGSFNSEKRLVRLADNVQEVKNANTVSGMFKWRADMNKNVKRNNQEEKTCESRFLVSSERESGSNFVSMFDGQEDIFL